MQYFIFIYFFVPFLIVYSLWLFYICMYYVHTIFSNIPTMDIYVYDYVIHVDICTYYVFVCNWVHTNWKRNLIKISNDFFLLWRFVISCYLMTFFFIIFELKIVNYAKYPSYFMLKGKLHSALEPVMQISYV